MNLAGAVKRIQKSFDKMNEVYGRMVFDEIAILSLKAGTPKLHYYEGPRKKGFMSEFVEDSIALRKELPEGQTSNGGEFGFTREGEGSRIDAYICLGAKAYLFCNNTEKSMQEVTEDPLWLEAQGEFLNASQCFAVDPLQIS